MDQEIQQRFEALEKRLAVVEEQKAASPQPTSQLTKEKSVGEFLQEKKPNSDPKKTRAIAYYLEHYKGYTSFTSEDIQKGYQSAKEPVPTNIADTIGKNIAGRFMMESEKKAGKRAWTLTSTGVKNVEAGFKGGEE